MSEAFPLPNWPRAHGGPAGSGILKASPEDFLVEEVLGFEPAGEGEFLWLLVEKRGANTRWVAGRIASAAGVPESVIGYGGLKDRQAVTRQWFSLPLAKGKEPGWAEREEDGWRVLQTVRHVAKLRRGDHVANRFTIRLNSFAGDRAHCEAILGSIAVQGFPNYFGEQRFGIDNANLSGARAWFNGLARPGRSEQGFLLSAARGLLFNAVLARRVEQGTWCSPLAGDLMEAADNGHCFPLPRVDEKLVERCTSGELSPTGPLYGSGEPRPSGEAGALEREVLGELVEWTRGLERQRLRADRRPLRSLAGELSWRWLGDDLTLGFELPTGSYATSLLREICTC